MTESPAEQSDFYRHVYEQVWDAIIVFRPEDERILHVNPKACALYGFSRDELVGMDLRTLSHSPEHGQAAIWETVRRGSLDAFETIHYHRDGSPLRIQASACVFEYEGAPAILSVLRDVTAQRQAEERLAESERQYRLMFESNPQPMWIFDLETLRFLAVNEAATRLYGYSSDQFLAMTALDIRPPDERERFLSEMRAAARFQNHSGAWTHCTADGKLIKIRAHSHRFKFAGRAARFVLIHDVTEELRAREELANREAYYRALIENSRDLITILDGQGTVIYESPSITSITGRTPAQCVGGSVFANVHPADVATAVDAFTTGVRKAAEPEPVELRLRHADGSWRTLEAVGRNLLHEPAIRGIVVNSRDVTERKNAEDAMRRSEEHLRLAQLAGGIGTWEFDLRTREWTSSAANGRMAGCQNTAPLALRDVIGLAHPEDQVAVKDAYERALAQGTPYAAEYRTIWPDGSIHWIASRGELFRNAAGEPDRFIGVSFDITERKRVEQELAAARDAALEASTMKSQFLATVSHEIRTPMNGIIGMAGLLLDSDLTEEQRADAAVIRTSALYLLELINDLLDFSRIEAGKLAIENSVFDLHACLETVVDLLSPQAAEKHLKLSLHYPAALPRSFVGNAGRLRQIVLNFAGNAVKFTDCGEVRIEVKAHRPGMVRIAVADTGPGISHEAQQRIFQKFFQVDSTPARRHGGTGLGLAISKSLAELMGGGVGVFSAPDKGSEFWVELPLPAAVPTEAPPLEGPSAEPPARYRGRVLIVEDNKVNQRLMVRLLEKQGLRVDVASNGNEALHMWSSFPYDLVFMDCHMPELDGFEATRRIRASENGGSHVPIVAVTAFADRTETAHCFECGMDSVLTKPFQPHQLASMLKVWIPHCRCTSEPQRRVSARQQLTASSDACEESCAVESHA